MNEWFARSFTEVRHGGLILRLRSFVISAALGVSILISNQQVGIAGLIVSLASDAPNLSQLQVGDPVHVQVDLAGLGSGEELTELSARVTFSASQLGIPMVNAGPIIPNPLADPLDFTVVASPGAADATFLTISAATAAHITSNGAFFEFIVQPLSLGQGAFQLVFADAEQIDPNDPGNLISPSITLGSPLDFAVVPEPSSITLLLLAIGVFVTIAHRKLQS